MVRLTRIYTRTGDSGTTALGDFSRTDKNDPRLCAAADVDETNSSLGVALALGRLPDAVASVVLRLQNELFDVGADLCTPIQPHEQRLRIDQRYIDLLESECDAFNAHLAPLGSFILPGGPPDSALLHQSRAISRRAERAAWRAVRKFPESTNPLTATYLNRLSDLLFILARTLASGSDVLWRPGGER